jgi:membrane-associated phospholipid phosphatase
MRFVKHLGITAERVHACDLRAFDARWFGAGWLGWSSGPESWPDFFRTHGSLGWDLAFAIPYGTFLFVTVAYAIWLYLRDQPSLQRFGWSFFAVNIAGYMTYHLFPAAPPWYVAAHGCNVDLGHAASTGSHLARVDDWLGVPYFASFYARSNDVFGAMPSLHVAYPLLVVLVGWRHHAWFGRSLALGFFVAMAAAAIYLDHHWVSDVLAGSVYTGLAYGLVRRWFP